MFESQDLINMFVFLAVFLVIAGLGAAALVWYHRDNRRAVERLRELAPAHASSLPEKPRPRPALATLPKVGALLLPKEQERVIDLRTQLLYAGFYNPHALQILLALKLFLVIGLAILCGAAPYLLGLLSWDRSLVGCMIGVTTGMFGPNYVLHHCTAKRQSQLRRGMPDMLDMLVLCLEGGVSLNAAMQRVNSELHWAHPELAAEMNIVQRNITLGMSAGEALKRFADRCGLDEVRDLSSVLLQSERFGASVVKALRTHADSSRLERQQRAEEKAQKAAVKILFPTLLCIFPAIFIVLLGPAAFQLAAMFSQMK